MPTITLTPEESEKYFYDAICNAVGSGYMEGYGITMDWAKEDYKKAQEALKAAKPAQAICFEEVLMQILRGGGTLTFKDLEGDGENTKSVTMKEVHERVQKTPTDHLMDMINENDDAVTADVILQTVFFEDVIFG